LSDSVLAAAVVTFVAIVALALLFKDFFGRWMQDRLTENPQYRAVLSQHFAKLRRYFLVMLLLAVVLAAYATFERNSLAAVGAGSAAGLPVLWHIMRTAFVSRAIKP
jgi:formate-dependent nitrite reductase membrane component NrfD